MDIFEKVATKMKLWKRRSILSLVLVGSLIGCGNSSVNPFPKEPPEALDARVLQTVDRMHDLFPATKELSEKATGVLVIPLSPRPVPAMGVGKVVGAFLFGQEFVVFILLS